MRHLTPSLAVLALAVTAAACGGDDSDDGAGPGDTADVVAEVEASPDAALETASPQEVAELLEDPPEELVVLDVRTPEEFAEARLDGATMLDFYESDFREQLGELDRDTPYVLYCRSGNRSGQALEMMRELGFTSVTEAEGGILAWLDAGLPVTSG